MSSNHPVNKHLLQRSFIRLIQLLDNQGYLIVSFRSTNQVENREQGKLYESIDVGQFISFFTKNNCEVLAKSIQMLDIWVNPHEWNQEQPSWKGLMTLLSLNEKK